MKAAAVALAALTLTLASTGCARKAAPAAPRLVGVAALAADAPELRVRGRAAARPDDAATRGRATRVHALAGGSGELGVVVGTDRNYFYGYGEGLTPRFLTRVADAQDVVRPPVVLGERLVFPVAARIEIFSVRGVPERTQDLGLTFATDPVATGDGLLLAGVVGSTGGRVVALDVGRQIRPVVTDVLLGQLGGAPAELNGTIYAAAEGKVYAATGARQQAWQLDRGAFATDRVVAADLKVDEYGVYVASTDTKLYCLDPTTGRIRWRYFAQAPLRAAPVVGADYVYQHVEGVGVVAVPKTTGPEYRVAAWVAEGADRVLGESAGRAVVLAGGNRVIALDAKTGEPVARSAESGYLDAAVDAQGRMYALTAGGELQQLEVR